MKLYSTLLLSAALCALAPTAMAMTASQKVEKEVTRTAADGTVETEIVKADLVTPGEKVIYTLDLFNDKTEPATNLKLAMPVPPHVKYIEGSADKPGTVVRYSSDGGQTFAAREALTAKAAGGVSRSATTDDITHIQWEIAGPISAGEADAVSFKARLR